MRPVATLIALSAGFVLQGCIAAAAIPVVASGALVRSQTDGEVADVSPPQKATPVEPRFVQLAGTEAQIVSGHAFIGEAPAPDAAPNPQGQGDAIWGLTRITDYARGLMETSRAEGAPVSAVLADPSSLRPERARCAGTTPMILLDLDPAGRLFDAQRMPAASPQAIETLRSYREAGGFIAWISGHSAIAAGDIRSALKSSGLDPDNADQLLLMRYPGDRKQTRREELAESSCLLAIAGDDRADFDELFDYLANPDAALGLELLIDNGWFLMPAFNETESSTLPANEETQQ